MTYHAKERREARGERVVHPVLQRADVLEMWQGGFGAAVAVMMQEL